VIQDPRRVYTVNVSTSTVSTKSKKLANGTTASVPEATVFPNTTAVTDPVIEFPEAKSKVEFGSFDAKGKAVWAPLWRVFAHELCGHGRLKQTYAGDTGDRPGHDSTIDTENAIAGKFGLPARGHYSDPRQGESFFNETGKRGKVVFVLKDGLHFEAP
jgi:hypothetical protein